MLAEKLGQRENAERWLREAGEIKTKFNDVFWDEGLNSYILALDGKKNPCRVIASNAGHALFCGIADIAKAKRVVDTLMSEQMFSGWGIRTLSTNELRYNPMSYHNGSVWPHDVAMIASGFSRYGFRTEAMRLTESLFNASIYLDLQRLPELFCGFPKRKGEGPTLYPVACSPQAWSVGAVYMLLESCLHMEILAVEKKIIFRKPIFPEFIDRISINGLNLGPDYLNIVLQKFNEEIVLNTNNTTNWEVMLIR
jgi:glycogen debranching enzyme